MRQADGSFAYMGDEGQRKLQIGSSLDVAISDNGKKVFQNITNAARLDATLTSTAGSDLAVSAPLVQDEVAFSGSPAFPSTGIEIRFGDTTTVPPGDAKDYKIYDGAVLVQSSSLDDDDSTDFSVSWCGGAF